jgi:hypothetical protein
VTPVEIEIAVSYKTTISVHLKLQLKIISLNATEYHFITTKLLDFFHRPDFYKPENTTFRKLDLFPSSGVGGRHLLYRKTKSLPFHRRCQNKRRSTTGNKGTIST